MARKGKQEELPGMEARGVPEIEQAADRYRQIRDERCALSKEEAEAKAALIQVMKNKGRQFYSYNGLNVQLSNQENVKVKSKDEDEDYEPVGRFTEPKRKRSSEEVAVEWIEQAEEMIEQQQQAEMEEDASREAVAEFFDGKPEGVYLCAGCEALVEIDLSATDGLCSRCWTPDAIKDLEERAAFIAENSDDFTPGFPPGFDPERTEQGLGQSDDYTASRCDECKMIEGGHAPACSKSNALRFDDYLAYARTHYKTNHQSHARKMELTKLKDDEVRAWKQQAGNTVEAEPEPKEKGRKKLSPVEGAIDR